MTAQYWRTIRLKVMQAGVGDPMKLPTMHVLLDLAESLIMESFQSDDPAEDKRDRQQFLDALYKPPVRKRSELPDGWRPPPPGFDDVDAMESTFDAFTSAARAG